MTSMKRAVPSTEIESATLVLPLKWPIELKEIRLQKHKQVFAGMDYWLLHETGQGFGVVFDAHIQITLHIENQ